MVSLILVTNGAVLSSEKTLQPDVGGEYLPSSYATMGVFKCLGSTCKSDRGFSSKTGQKVRPILCTEERAA